MTLKTSARIFGAIALLLAGTASAQNAPAATAPLTDADPALWVVKDADTTIYLFGTIHVLKPGLSWFDEAVKTAFDKSDQLVLEMVTPDQTTMQALAIKTGFTATGPTLPEKLGEADRVAYLKTLGEFGIPAAALDRAKPWMAAITLTTLPLLKLGYDINQAPEHVLSEAATAAKKPVIGLETAEEQLGIFDALPEPVQIKFLDQTVRELPKAGEEIGKMVSSWSAGDPDALAKTMNEGMAQQPEVGKALLTDRNIRWANWIDTRLKTPGTVFVAVGAGHLAGKDSVQVQLGTHKLTATRVKY